MKKNYIILLLLASLLVSCVERRAVIAESQDYQFEKILPDDLQNKVDTAKQKHLDSMDSKQNECDCDTHENDANSIENAPAKPILGKDPATYTPVKKLVKKKTKVKIAKPKIRPEASPAISTPESNAVVSPAPAKEANSKM